MFLSNIPASVPLTQLESVHHTCMGCGGRVWGGEGRGKDRRDLCAHMNTLTSGCTHTQLAASIQFVNAVRV